MVITVPASFDETARKLTLEAARLAGLSNIMLLEEPQAVCYDWHHRHQAQPNDILQDVPLILVCDVGGGTTDLSLIAAQFDEQETLQLNRIGVGDHLMLCGDNIDLALAHVAERRFNQNKTQRGRFIQNYPANPPSEGKPALCRRTRADENHPARQRLKITRRHSKCRPAA